MRKIKSFNESTSKSIDLKLQAFINKILKESGITKDQYIKAQKSYVDYIMENSQISYYSLNFYIDEPLYSNTQFINSIEINKDINKCKHIIKDQMDNIISYWKRINLFDDIKEEFENILLDITDQYSLPDNQDTYNNSDFKSLIDYHDYEHITVHLFPNDMNDLAEIGKIFTKFAIVNKRIHNIKIEYRGFKVGDSYFKHNVDSIQFYYKINL